MVIFPFGLSAMAFLYIIYLYRWLMVQRTGKDLVASTKGGESGEMGGQLDHLAKQIKVRMLERTTVPLRDQL
jgi:hypothetical protein